MACSLSALPIKKKIASALDSRSSFNQLFGLYVTPDRRLGKSEYLCDLEMAVCSRGQEEKRFGQMAEKRTLWAQELQLALIRIKASLAFCGLRAPCLGLALHVFDCWGRNCRKLNCFMCYKKFLHGWHSKKMYSTLISSFVWCLFAQWAQLWLPSGQVQSVRKCVSDPTYGTWLFTCLLHTTDYSEGDVWKGPIAMVMVLCCG